MGQVIRSVDRLAISRLSGAGSHSVPGIDICEGTGIRPSSATGGTNEPPCDATSGIPATRDDRYAVSVKPTTTAFAPVDRRNAASDATDRRTSSGGWSRSPGRPICTRSRR